MTGKAKETRPKISRSRRAQKTDRKAQTRTKARDYIMATGEVTSEERHQLIAIAAYYLSERRGFLPGLELQDWLEAEARIDQGIGSGQA